MMKRIKWTLLAGWLSCLVAGCTADAPIAVEDAPGLVEIKLNGSVGALTVSATTKASVSGQGNWTEDLPVSFARADEGESGYPDWTTESILNATVGKNKIDNTTAMHPVTFDSPVYYLANGKNSKLIGWYPRINASAGDYFSFGGVMLHAKTMDGKTPYMATNLVMGNKSQNDRIPSVTFTHLLMQISVKAYTPDEKGAEMWGGIKSIAIRGMQQGCFIELPAAEDADPGDGMLVSFGSSSDGDLPLVKTDFINNTEIVYNELSPLPLGVGTASHAVLAGYAMFAPQEHSNFTLIVDMEGGGKQEAIVTPPRDGFLAGYSYEVVLKFTRTDIAPTVTVKDWIPGPTLGEVVL